MLAQDPFRTFFEDSVDGLLMIDSEGVVRFANRVARAWFASKTAELVGFQLGAPAIHEPVEIMIPGSDGIRYVEMRSTDIAWHGGIASLASLRDITERKESEEAPLKPAVDLLARNDELIRFNRVAVGRELRMIDLKREVNELCERLGEPPRYEIPKDREAELA